jgi:hypothetical protein
MSSTLEIILIIGVLISTIAVIIIGPNLISLADRSPKYIAKNLVLTMDATVAAPEQVDVQYDMPTDFWRDGYALESLVPDQVSTRTERVVASVWFSENGNKVFVSRFDLCQLMSALVQETVDAIVESIYNHLGWYWDGVMFVYDGAKDLVGGAGKALGAVGSGLSSGVGRIGKGLSNLKPWAVADRPTDTYGEQITGNVIIPFINGDEVVIPDYDKVMDQYMQGFSYSRSKNINYVFAENTKIEYFESGDVFTYKANFCTDAGMSMSCSETEKMMTDFILDVSSVAKDVVVFVVSTKEPIAANLVDDVWEELNGFLDEYKIYPSPKYITISKSNGELEVSPGC